MQVAYYADHDQWRARAARRGNNFAPTMFPSIVAAKNVIFFGWLLIMMRNIKLTRQKSSDIYEMVQAQLFLILILIYYFVENKISCHVPDTDHYQ